VPAGPAVSGICFARSSSSAACPVLSAITATWSAIPSSRATKSEVWLTAALPWISRFCSGSVT